MKKTWTGIRELINVKKKSETKISKLIVENNVITDPVAMASTMNSFFVNMGSSVASKIPNSKKAFSDYLSESSNFNIILNPCSSAEINKLISDLNWSKASGPYSIPSNIIRLFKDVFVEPITSLVNKSLAEGIFPDILKWASVLPFFKKE